MGIRLRNVGKKRDWKKIASGASETIVQAATLAKFGIGNPISPIFRSFEALKGEDPIELRALTLVQECLAYAVGDTISGSSLRRRLQAPETGDIVERFLLRAELLIEQDEIIFQPEHLAHPDTFTIFQDAAEQIVPTLKPLIVKESKASIQARFGAAVRRGINRIRLSRSEYFQPIVDALSGSDAIADARERAWTEYRACLVRRFENTSLFGEEGAAGATLAQVYVPLRAWWASTEGQQSQGKRAERGPGVNPASSEIHVVSLGDHIKGWLSDSESKHDVIRLVSGGPGSGKSTFARQLAAELAANLEWRTVLVPLQRLRGIAFLDRMIDEYFVAHGDEPFRSETAPLSTLGKDQHKDWFIIFDGLDELAKEGIASESAAQEFASSLLDWRVRIGQTANVRFLILGRAPSMQDASKRLALEGARTLHIADMRPIREQLGGPNLTMNGDDKLIAWDQRPFFWERWAAAKGRPLPVPKAMTHESLAELTKEPLLAYLLILSGYVNERWTEAAENRNLIYEAIFNQIWDRERRKDTRSHLNALGHEAFKSLMRSLALAAWRGGGRTGDVSTFNAMRSTFMPPGHLKLAEEHGVSDLSSVAILFYTRRDEAGGAGYEFLHKSFGEYLTAQAIFDAFTRWGDRATDVEDEFTIDMFLGKWLALTGAAPITAEILKFLNDEVRLLTQIHDIATLEFARKSAAKAATLVDGTIKNGMPAHRESDSWRAVERNQRNAEEALLAVLSACAKAAYPSSLFGAGPDQGGWGPGPISIPTFQSKPNSFSDLVGRLKSHDQNQWHLSSGSIDILSRLDLRSVKMLENGPLYSSDFTGCNFDGCVFAVGYMAGVTLSKCNLRHSDLSLIQFRNCSFDQADLTGADMNDCVVVNCDFEKSNLTRISAHGVVFLDCKFQGAVGARRLRKKYNNNKHVGRISEA